MVTRKTQTRVQKIKSFVKKNPKKTAAIVAGAVIATAAGIGLARKRRKLQR